MRNSFHISMRNTDMFFSDEDGKPLAKHQTMKLFMT